MQEDFSWIPPSGPLGRLTRAAHARADSLLPRLAELRDRGRECRPAPPFATALRQGPHVAVVAEIKRQSPSKGILNAGIDAADRAMRYVAGGAAALSVLTEPVEFGGRNEDLAKIRSRVSVPLLKKDFHVHEVQVWEARVLGASAILLIARALTPRRLECLVNEALEAGLEIVVEIRDERELARALNTPASVIGVNARDLETLRIEPEVTARLLPAIPPDRVGLAESGITSPDDVARAAAFGAQAVLIGSSLSLAADVDALLSHLCRVDRHSHAH